MSDEPPVPPPGMVFPPGYPAKVPCGHCGLPTWVPGPPPTPTAKPLCGLCLNLSISNLTIEEQQILAMKAKETASQVKAASLSDLVAMHVHDDKHPPRSFQEAYLMAVRGRLGMGRLFTIMDEQGIELPFRRAGEK